MRNGIFRRIFGKLGGYDAANEYGKGRAAVPVERRGEDAITPEHKRARIIAVQRDAYRNTTFSPATAWQLQVNVVGTEGGKLSVVTPDAGFNAAAGAFFRRWARRCGFTDGTTLNENIRLMLTQLTHNGGDFIVVFDNGILTGDNGSGKVRVFESDEIKNVEDSEFARLYPAKGADGELSHVQRNGIVYDTFGRIVGAFVSTSGRGQAVFEKGKYIHLRLDTPGDFSGSPWFFVANRWRVNQGRGISTSTHVTNLLADIAAMEGSEVQAAKLNAAFGLTIQDTEAAPVDTHGGGDSDEIGGEGEAESGTADAESDAEKAENDALKTAQTQLMDGQSAIVRLAYNRKMESFKTDRPNMNVGNFADRGYRRGGTVYGLPPPFVTLEPAGSYTAFRGALQMAERTFAVWRKKLERDVLDPLALLALRWGGFDADGLEDALKWNWPKMIEVDEGSYQTALEKKFALGGATFADEYGPGWLSIIEQQAAEKAECEARGLVYPAIRGSSGGVVAPADGDAADAPKPGENANDKKDAEETRDYSQVALERLYHEMMNDGEAAT